MGPMLLDVAQCVSSVSEVFQKDKVMSKVAQLSKGAILLLSSSIYFMGGEGGRIFFKYLEEGDGINTEKHI